MRASTGGGAARQPAPAATTTIPQPTSPRLSIEPSAIIAPAPLHIPSAYLHPWRPPSKQARRQATRLLAPTAYSLQLPAEAPSRPCSHQHLVLHLGPHLLHVPQRDHAEGGTPRRRRGVAVGRTAHAAPRVERQLEHTQLLRRHRHLVRRARLEVVDSPLVVIRRIVRADQLDILLVLHLCERSGGKRQVASGTPESIRANARKVDEVGRRCGSGSWLP